MKKLLLHQWTEQDRLKPGSYPYLEDALACIMANCGEKSGECELHLFYAEDVQPPVAELRRELPHLFPDCVMVITAHERPRVEHDSVQAVHQFVREFLTDAADGADTIYLHPGHGERLFQHLLTHECVQRYPEQLYFLSGKIADENKGTPLFEQLRVEAYMEEERLFHLVRDLILSDNYRAVRRLIAGQAIDPTFERLLQLGEKLWLLDFDTYDFRYRYQTRIPESTDEQLFDLLADTLERFSVEKEQIEFVYEMKQLCFQHQRSFIYYLYSRVNIHYELDQLVDFLVLFYRLVEEWALYVLGWDIKPNGYLYSVKQRKQAVPLPYPPPSKYLHVYEKYIVQEVRRVEERKRIKIHETNRADLVRLSTREREYAELYLLLSDKNMRELLDLRHEGVSGHGFEDYRKEEFEQYAGGQAPLARIKPLLEAAGLVPPYSIFHLLNHALLCLLDERIFALHESKHLQG